MKRIKPWQIITTFGIMGLLTVSCFAATGNQSSNSGQQISMRPQQLPLSQSQLKSIMQSAHIVQQGYVDDVDTQELTQGAIEGMLRKLDPHSSYLSAQDLENLRSSTQGHFAGVGIQVSMEDGLLEVIAPIADTPADKAGIKAGDYIIRIDGKPVQDMSIDQAVNLMRGKVGTDVDLVVIDPNSRKPKHITITREKIDIHPIDSEVLDHRFGYIQIKSFQSQTGEQLKSALDGLEKETDGQLAGIILDLRNNAGGIIDGAQVVSDMFLDADALSDKTIVYTKGRSPDAQMRKKAKTSDMTHGIPIVVLVNHGSASASEIVAGALRDHHRAVIVGSETFGKGTVQSVIPLDDGALKLTIAHYYTPSGDDIQEKGITPDIRVSQKTIEYDPEQQSMQKRLRLSQAILNGQSTSDDQSDEAKDDKPLAYRDYQLSVALNILQGLASQAKQSGD